MTTRTINWSRILAEGMVIVVSILLALAADAWWGVQQGRAEEQLYLSALLDDVSGVIAGADSALLVHAELEERSLARSEFIRAHGQVPDTLFAATRREHTAARVIRNSLDTWADLTATGAVTTVTVPEVRWAMARLSKVMELERQHSIMLADAAFEANLQLTYTAVSEPANLADMVLLAEENGRNNRGFNSALKREAVVVAEEAREVITLALERTR